MGTKTRKLGNIDTQLVEWQAVFTGDGSTGLTAVAGRGYFIDTTSGTVEVTLPSTVSSNVGDKISIKDFARTFGTNAVTIASNLFDGVHGTNTFETNGQTISLVYSGSTKGWMLINEDTSTNLGAEYIAATGGTVTTSGNYKIHSFTGDGCFVVSSAGNCAGSNKVSYLVVAGGGSGGADVGGGGGAGGFREGRAPAFDSYTASPLVAPDGLPVSVQTYPISVGGGGAVPGAPPQKGNAGSNSVFSTITSAGGGLGGGGPAPGTDKDGGNGGSGGGGGGWTNPTRSPCIGNPGSGNTPPVSPPQGNAGGAVDAGGSSWTGAGGGGAGGAGTAGGPSPCLAAGTKAGGAGVASEITGSPVTYAAGGSGGNDQSTGPNTTTAAANLGGGGGGAGNFPTPNKGNAGGKGVVIIRYKFQGS